MGCCKAFTFSRPHSKPAAFWETCEWARVTHPNEEYAASEIQRGPLGIMPLSWL